MKYIPLDRIEDVCFSLSSISAIDYVPIQRTLSHENGRRLNGLLYLIEGECRFTSRGGCVNLHPGGLIYLPQGSVHRYAAVSESVRYMRIDFIMREAESNEEILFSDGPLLLTENASAYLDSLLRELTSAFMSGVFGYKLKCLSLLCDLLYTLSLSRRNDGLSVRSMSRLLPGLRYIENTYSGDFDIEHAAELCGLSVSRFRAVFRRTMGVSVLEYRERIRMEKACVLLRNQSCRIGEIAERLGFGSIYYFSRCFKKYMGVSPSEYRL